MPAKPNRSPAPPKRDPKKDAALRDFIGKEKVDRLRVAYQGYTPEKNRRIYDRKRKMWLVVSNAEHRARLAVAGGTIKALTTSALPDQPSMSWLYKTDRNVRHDDDEREAREAAARGAMAAAHIIAERASLPAKPTRIPSLEDLEDGQTPPSRGGARHSEPGRRFWYAPTAPPIAEIPSPDQAYMAALDALERQTASLDAQRQLEELRRRANVSEQDFSFVKEHLTKRTSWRALAKTSRGPNRQRLSHETVRQRAGAAIDALVKAAGVGYDAGLLSKIFQAGYTHE